MANMASILDVANWFLSKESMTPKKLQKLCYYYVAWGYALFGEDLAPDAEFQAWVHGPVSPRLYSNYREFGWNDIPKADEPPVGLSDRDIELLESVYVTYGPLSANELSALSHSELPWRKARGNCAPDEMCRNLINADDMRTYYLSVYEQQQGE